ncbi:MAG: GNAT family N-acetyltransferase [Candidatus Cloacimonetes bacterium]|nr:GNAT family N-acetyltransferase [Candidatus Cloacimonadota bacterium]
MKRIENITYRKIKLADKDIFIEYRIRFLQEIQKPEGDVITKNLEDCIREYFEEKIPSNQFIAFVAEKDGNPIGFGGMVIQENPGHYKLINGKQAYILNMYTLPDFRGLGICRKILTLLKETAFEMGIHRLSLLATEMGNEIYRDFGFKEPDWTYLELDF